MIGTRERSTLRLIDWTLRYSAEKGGEMTIRQFTFLLDRDGTLLRQDQFLISDVFWPGADMAPMADKSV